MATLRGPGGCPWDREQTHTSLRAYLLEEAYEVLEAIDAGDPQRLREELGDLLLQVVFHAQIASERGAFTIWDVVAGIHDKLVRRHPHVFGGLQGIQTAQQVKERWDALKRAERPDAGSALDGVPPSLPALARAQKLYQRASQAGFEWPNARSALDKVHEEPRRLARRHVAGRGGEHAGRRRHPRGGRGRPPDGGKGERLRGRGRRAGAPGRLREVHPPLPVPGTAGGRAGPAYRTAVPAGAGGPVAGGQTRRGLGSL
ncbi:MAG: nucleoside triphosphate pyrophosphohydrolase [candidate division GAL15 bacterium]